MSHSSDSSQSSNTETIRALQSRINAVLSGTAVSGLRIQPTEERPLFAAFDPRDQQRALALAGLWMKIADEYGGAHGLDRAINYIEESLYSNYPIGMVKYAVELFLTHYAPARDYLELPSLEHIQPYLVRPSSSETQGL